MAVDASDNLIAAGTVFLELKFVRDHGRCGHISDLVARNDEVLEKLVQVLHELVWTVNDGYKVTVNCQDSKKHIY